MTNVAPEIVEAVVAAARAAAAALPSAGALVPGMPVTNLAELPLPADAAAAVVAELRGDVRGSSLVVVGRELVDALSANPLGDLDLAAIVRPGLTAAAAAFGAVTAEAGTSLPVDVALEGLAGAGLTVAVPLLAGAEVALVYAAAVAPAGSAQQRRSAAGRRAGGLELLRDVEMEVTVELGRTSMTVRELLSLAPGSVVELDRAAGSPADLLVNGTLIARGEVVVIDEEYGIRITELVGPGTEAEAAA